MAAMPLRDSLYPVGAVPPYGWDVPLAGKRFSANHRTFAGADILSARQRNFTNLLFPLAERDPFSVLLVAACPAEASTAFLFDFLPARRGPKPLFLLHRNNLDYLCKALKYRHFRGYGQGIYYRFTTFTERALICAAPREPDARRGRHTDRPPTMTISYTDHDGVSSLPTRGEKGRRFFYALCYAVGA